MPDGTVEAKKGRKFNQVLEGARKVFLCDGFEGTSVDDIARAACVSKATLYSYFPDKRFLFMHVAKNECCKLADNVIDNIATNAPVRDILSDIAIQMVEFITSDFGKRIFRICVGEGDRFPELAREFYESGPKMVRDQLVVIFAKAIERGELVIEDQELAADQFHELCKADLFTRIVFNMQDEFTDAERQRIAQGAVDMFMARYGVKTAALA
ncbi:TetR/AcrR family transcriptional regulator [Loktanella agnita]|uniref:TetR/AcrR family transcriptional regulator n=1 Tax=Loktanella agnita TaxID=287097 RepID=UPI003989E694